MAAAVAGGGAVLYPIGSVEQRPLCT